MILSSEFTPPHGRFAKSRIGDRAAAVTQNNTLGPVHTTRGAALRGKNGPDEAESEELGGSKFEGDNEVWPVFPRNPKGRGRRCSSRSVNRPWLMRSRNGARQRGIGPCGLA